jgi:hypothetical protein
MLKGMGDKVQMAAPVSKAFCEQFLCPEKQNDAKLIVTPSQLPSTLNGIDTDSEDIITGGVVLTSESTIVVPVSSGGQKDCVLLMNCGASGFKDFHDLLFSDGLLWVGGGLPATLATGLSSSSSCPKYMSPSRSTLEDDVKAIVLGCTFEVEINTAVATDRQGDIFCGWVDDTSGKTWAVLAETAGVQQYDGALLTQESDPVVFRPPWAMSINKGTTGVAPTWSASQQAGYMFVAGKDVGLGTTFVVKITNSVLYIGQKIDVEVAPIFSTAAFDCALTCFQTELGRANSYTKREQRRFTKEIVRSAGRQTMAHTSPTLFDSVVSTAKSVGGWLWKEAKDLLPELVAGLL